MVSVVSKDGSNVVSDPTMLQLYAASGEMLCDVVVDADASMGQLKARIRTKLLSEYEYTSQGKWFEDKSIVIGDTTFDCGDDYTRFMLTKVVKQCLQWNPDGSSVLIAHIIVHSIGAETTDNNVLVPN